jgi:hypothetical protein
MVVDDFPGQVFYDEDSNHTSPQDLLGRLCDLTRLFTSLDCILVYKQRSENHVE